MFNIFPKLENKKPKIKSCMHGFKNRNGQRTGKETDYWFYGLIGVEPMVKPMMS